jgi:hypothetical protein
MPYSGAILAHQSSAVVRQDHHGSSTFSASPSFSSLTVIERNGLLSKALVPSTE